MSFVTANYGFHWELWELQHKAIFDGLNKTITIGPETSVIDVKVDIYSAWKQWAMAAENMKWAAALRSTGGDPIPGRFLGATFFLINGWRIILDHGVDFTGNLYTEEGDSVFIALENQQVSTATVSNLVDLVEIPAAVGSAVLAQAVWDLSTTNVITGSMGDVLLNLQDATISATSLVDNGGTAISTNSSIQTLLSKPDGYYDDSFIIIIDSVGNNVATRQIDKYFATGQVDLIDPLPFVPSDGASIIMLNKHSVSRGRVG